MILASLNMRSVSSCIKDGLIESDVLPSASAGGAP